jgi:aminoglycoside 6'-N-acetyltransferase I
MQIINLVKSDDVLIHSAAEALVEAFHEHWPDAWPTVEDALEEVNGFFLEDRIIRAAITEEGQLLGWIGALSIYDGVVWELHPLAVNPRFQRQGIGRKLVEDLEQQIALRGGLTIWLGTDDEDLMTTLGGADLYPDPLEALARIKNLRGHPYEFYQRVGFVLSGVLPDANGFGKPDIFMSKRVTRKER